MDEIQRRIIEAIDIIVNEKINSLKFDTTKRGVVKSINNSFCVVEIDGRDSICRVRDGVDISVDDIVSVKIPLNNYSDKIVEGRESMGIDGGSPNSYYSYQFNNADGGLPNTVYDYYDPIDAGGV